MDGAILLIALVICAVFGGITGMVARGRGHSFWPFFFLGALISPVLGIILTFVIAPPRQAQPVRRRGGRGGRGGRRDDRSRGRRSTTRRAAREPAPLPLTDPNPYAPPAGPFAVESSWQDRRR